MKPLTCRNCNHFSHINHTITNGFGPLAGPPLFGRRQSSLIVCQLSATKNAGRIFDYLFPATARLRIQLGHINHSQCSRKSLWHCEGEFCELFLYIPRCWCFDNTVLYLFSTRTVCKNAIFSRKKCTSICHIYLAFIIMNINRLFLH